MKETWTPGMTYLVLGMIFILVAGWMTGHANAHNTQQRLDHSIECLKTGGDPVFNEKSGAFECRKVFEEKYEKGLLKK